MRTYRHAPLVRIVDDDRDLRESLEFMLECEGYDVKSYASAREFLADDMPTRIGCLILDVRMPELTGLQLQEILNARAERLPIVFLTAHGDIDMAVQTMRDGACDFQQKPVRAETFLPAVARAVEKDRLRRSGAEDIAAEIAAYRRLSERERQVLRLVSQGLTSQAVADRLGISKRTVDHQRTDALKKLSVRSPAELAGFFERVEHHLAQSDATHTGKND